MTSIRKTTSGPGVNSAVPAGKKVNPDAPKPLTKGAGAQAWAATQAGALKGSSAVEGRGPLPISKRQVADAKASGQPTKMAKVLHDLVKDRSNLLLPNDATRVERTQQLMAGMSLDQVSSMRTAYIVKYGADPEIHLNSVDLGQPLARLSTDTELSMMRALNGPQMKADAKTLSQLLGKAEKNTLTAQDRTRYYSLLPKMGLWDKATRGGSELDSKERKLLKAAFGETQPNVSLDAALKKIESKLPPADLSPKGPREKSVAIIASSHGAQWQELMDFAVKMKDAGYKLQVFTPDGRPVSFQRDSLNVSTRTVPLGYGSPKHLDPSGRAGDVATELLGNAANASKFEAKNFGAVYLAGGLGFNEDVAVAKAGADGKTQLSANKNITTMMNAAVAERLPVIGLCHGPTLLAATSITIKGKTHPLNQGIETASLPPFEGYVGLTGRKETQFTYDVNTHQALAATGGKTNVLKDVKDMSRVVKAHQDGMDIITGPGPQAAANLADAAIESIARRWR
jgi:putative intracellular protease/amidase